jgi:hypothetical protein
MVRLMTQVLGSSYSSRQATYDLRRLRRKGLIVRLAGCQRYQLTPFGRRVAVLFSKAHMRVLAPGLALLDPALPDDVADRAPLLSPGAASTASSMPTSTARSHRPPET